MKRTTAILLVICLSLTLAASDDAAAGWFSKNKNKKLSDKRTEMPEELKEPHRYDAKPTMTFHRGVLNRDSYTGWQVDDVSLQLARGCVVEAADATAAILIEGREAIIMGPRVGDTIVAWRVRLLTADYDLFNFKADTQLEVSATNPDVGKIISAPH